MMSARHIQKLKSILAKIESLQYENIDEDAKERLQSAKNELLRLYKRTVA